MSRKKKRGKARTRNPGNPEPRSLAARLPARNVTYAQAAGQRETAVRLEALPKGLVFGDDFPEPIHYDPVRKLLSYRGFMGSGSYRFLHQLSADPAYIAALDNLYAATSFADAGGGRWLRRLLVAAVILAALAVVFWKWVLQ